MSVGPVEIVIVLVLALLVFGPKQLPQMGRALGKSVREFRHAAETARSELGLDDITSELGKVKSGLDDLKTSVDVKGTVMGASAAPTEPAATPETPADTDGEAGASEAPPTEEVGYTKTPEAPVADDASQTDASTVPGA